MILKFENYFSNCKKTYNSFLICMINEKLLKIVTLKDRSLKIEKLRDHFVGKLNKSKINLTVRKLKIIRKHKTKPEILKAFNNTLEIS